MTVYNVSGKVAAHRSTKDEALETLRGMAARAELDLADERAYRMGIPAAPDWVATGTVAALFEAASEQEAIGRMMGFVFERARILPTGMAAFVSEDVPQEWVL